MTIDIEDKTVSIKLDEVIQYFNGDIFFEENEALAALIATGKLVYYPSTGKLYINCSDFFAWGCSDAEEFDYKHLRELYEMFLKDMDWGTEMFVAIQRKELPQNVVRDSILKKGIWDLDAFTEDHELRANYYSGVNSIESKWKFEICNKWREEQSLEPVEYNANWWKLGWIPFTKANPNWNDDYSECSRRINEWKTANGWTIV